VIFVLVFIILAVLKLSGLLAASWLVVSLPLIVLGAIWVVTGLIGFGLLAYIGKKINE